MTDKVWLYLDKREREIIAFSSEEKLMQWVQELYPEKKSLRLMPYGSHSWGHREAYILMNHNAYVLPWSHYIYSLELDTGEENFLW